MGKEDKNLLHRVCPELATALRLMPKSVRTDLDQLAGFLLAAYRRVGPGSPQKKAFAAFRKEWDSRKNLPMARQVTETGDSEEVSTIKHMCRLKIVHQLDESWIDAYLDAVQQDAVPKEYATMEDTLSYVFGSSEAAGMMVAKILGLPKRALRAASLQARAFQYVQSLRSVKADEAAGRRFFPSTELKLFGLQSLQEDYVRQHPEEFRSFVLGQLKLYNGWQRQALKEVAAMPKRYRTGVLAAIDMYRRIASQIEKEPMVIYTQRMHPSRWRMLSTAVIGLFD